MIVPVTYCIVLSSILVHGLSISFFTLGRRVHSRVASFSRTLTAQSGNSGFGRTFSFGTTSRADRAKDEEPSWMSRVKRATRAEDIVINRDDDDEDVRGGESPESLAEKGAAGGGSLEEDEKRGGRGMDDDRIDEEPEAEEEEEEAEAEEHAAAEARRKEGHSPTHSDVEREIEEEVEEDQGDLAMFGAPPKSHKIGAGKKEELIKKRKEKRRNGGDDDDEAAPGDRDEDIEERGGTDVEKEIETASDVKRGRHRAAEHRRELAEEHRREMDESPPHNILGDIGADDSDSESAKARYLARKKAASKGKDRETRGRRRSRSRSRSPSPVPMGRGGKRDPKLEARYCRGTQTWREGRKVRPPLRLRVSQPPARVAHFPACPRADHRRPRQRRGRGHRRGRVARGRAQS